MLFPQLASGYWRARVCNHV